MTTTCTDEVSEADDFIASLPQQEAKAGEWHSTASQREGLTRLHQLGDVFAQTGDSRLAGFRPAAGRILMIGASGSGKTALAGQFAAECEAALLTLDCGSWIVAGAAAKPATLRMVRDFLRAQGGGDGLVAVLFLDELCKLLPSGENLHQSGWSLSVWAECLSVLSGDTRLAAHEWSPEDIRRLRTNTMIIGAGAFQAALLEVRTATRKGTLGFSDSGVGKATYASQIAQYLPEELLSRFASEPIVLDVPSRGDFEAAINRIHGELGIKRDRPMGQLLDEAGSAMGGMRWCENYVCQLLIKHPYAARQAPSSQREEKADAKPRAFDLMVSDIPRCLQEANATAATLRVKLGVIYSALHAIVDRGQGIPMGGVLSDPKMGEALVEAIRNCQLCTEVSADDRDVLKPLARWKAMAWQALAENSCDLDKHHLREVWVESWSATGALIDYRLKLSQAVQRGLLG
jgi:hypothetical protein